VTEVANNGAGTAQPKPDHDGDVERHLLLVPGGATVRVQLLGQGPFLLMINGIGGHIDMWEPLARELSRTHRLVLFDAPGAGMSPPLPKLMRLPGLAGVVVQLLDALDIAETDVLGYSWGGALAQQLAHDHPERVRRLVLVASIPGLGGRPPRPRVVAAMLSPDRYQSPERSKQLTATIYGGDYRLVEGRTPRELAGSWHAHPPSARGYSQQLFAISGWSSLPWLHRMAPRTLIISGEDDPLVPRLNARMLARLIPRSELHLVPGAGHLWALDHAAQSAALIEGFLTGP
jgi:pimeloyl-ACP methyl ester carboxylesterase